MLPSISEKPNVTKISRISSIVSFNGCVLATKISGTSASTSIAPEVFEISKDFAEVVKLIFYF